MGADGRTTGFPEDTAAIMAEDTRRSLLAKAGLVAGGIGVVTLARPGSALAHAQTFGVYDVTAHASIQEAIDHVPTSGGTVVVPAGTYTIDAGIKLKSRVTLLGLGRSIIKPSATLKAGPPGVSRLVEMQSFSAGSNNYAQFDVTIQGLVFDGDDWMNTQNALVSLYSTDTLRVMDCEFQNFRGGTLHIGGCRNITLRGLKFRDWGRETHGSALTVAGNNVPGDTTPSVAVRGYDLDFRNGSWAAMQPLCTDFVFSNVTIKDTGEGGVYTQGFNWDGLGEGGQGRTPDITQNGVFSNFRISGIEAKHVSASGFEIGGSNILVSDFVISDTDGPGLQMNWPAEDVTFENGQVYRTVRGSAVAPYLENYGQVHFIQRATGAGGTTNYSMRNINVRNVSIGKPSVWPPTAKYAIRFDGDTGVEMTNVVIWPNDMRYGGSVVPVIFTPSTSVAPSANSANTETGTPPRPYLTHKVFSETESVELFAQTWGNGKNAVLEARGKDAGGAEVRAQVIARSAPDVSIGSTSNHDVVFIQNGGETFRINTSGHLQVKDQKNFVLGTGTGTMIGTAAGQKLGFYGKLPVIQRAAIPGPSTSGSSLQTAVNRIRQALIDLGLTA